MSKNSYAYKPKLRDYFEANGADLTLIPFDTLWYESGDELHYEEFRKLDSGINVRVWKSIPLKKRWQ